MADQARKKQLYRPAVLHQHIPSSPARKTLSQGYLIAQISNGDNAFPEDQNKTETKRSLFQSVNTSVQPIVKGNDNYQDDVSLFSDEEESQQDPKDLTVIEGTALSKDAMRSNIQSNIMANQNANDERYRDTSSDDANFSKQTRAALSSLMANSPTPKVGNSPVLIVDALGRTADPQATEVAVVTTVAKSAAKVVCHSPSEKNSNKDDSVHVTAVPRVRIKIADRIAEEERKHEEVVDNVLALESASSVDNTKVKINDIEAQDVTQLVTNKDLDSDQDVIRKSVKKNTKPKPRYVASRYLSGISTNRTKTTTVGKSHSKAEKGPMIGRHDLHATRTTPKTSNTGITAKSFSRLGKKQDVMASTPSDRQQASKLRTVRTPQDFSIRRSRNTKTPIASASKRKPPIKVLPTDKKETANTTVDNKAETRTQMEKKKGSIEVTQSELDLVYARLMQWVFAYQKLKHTVNTQEKEAMNQIFSMWKHLHQQNRKLTQLKLELQLAKHTSLLDDVLDMQKSELQVIGDLLPRVKSDYSNLAKGLDAVSHVLRTKGILYMDDHDEVISALGESEELLGEIISITRHNQENVTAVSQSMCGLADKATVEGKELHRCEELLGALSTLVVQESSLRVQEIEESRADSNEIDNLSLHSMHF